MIVYDINWVMSTKSDDGYFYNEEYPPSSVDVPFSVYDKDGYCGVVDYLYKK